MEVFRCPQNPIIKPDDIKPSREDFEVIGVFNPAVARFDNEVILLLRVAERPVSNKPGTVLAAVYDTAKAQVVLKEFSRKDSTVDFSDPRLIITPSQTYLTSISHLRLARSTDGIHFDIDDCPAIFPGSDYESFGIEDARITAVDSTYYISYVGVSAFGITTCLISTRDFKFFSRQGVIFCPDNKDVVIFPGRVRGNYYALHRPVSSLFKKHDIWISQSSDLVHWGNHRYLMGLRAKMWDEMKIGAGAVPFRIEDGWLEIYHGADQNNRYCLGALLLDADEPSKVLARSKVPILEPEAEYEQKGFFGNVVFSCGLLAEEEKLKIYYGAADATVCYAEIPLKDCLRTLDFSKADSH
ncbi:MAG: glycoside hydrolase family 130 protein [Sedimentisphaerales bacterium]|nr:glycoside hydrolase family 130 protein [Sedimentisphaerales bacterium]